MYEEPLFSFTTKAMMASAGLAAVFGGVLLGADKLGLTEEVEDRANEDKIECKAEDCQLSKPESFDDVLVQQPSAPPGL